MNQGSTQPKFDARVDYDFTGGEKLSFTGGVAGTDGMMHSGIGPFDIESGTVMGYAKAAYTSGNLRAALFTNILNGDAANLLTTDPITGQTDPLQFQDLHVGRGSLEPADFRQPSCGELRRERAAQLF